MNQKSILYVKCPPNFCEERKYVFDFLFRYRLGLEYQLVFDDELTDKVKIKIAHETLIFKDAFFSKIPQGQNYINSLFLPESVRFTFIPDFTLEHDLPIIYGSAHFELETGQIQCGIDLFAGCFFFLARWEELLEAKTDWHDRYPIKESYAFRNEIHLRPVVDEYVSFLQNLLTRIGIECHPRNKFKITPTCDVDLPIDPHYHSLGKMMKGVGADLIKRQSISKALDKVKNYSKVLANGYKSDPNYTFDYQMGMAEKYGLSHAFYFICGHSSSRDGYYQLSDPIIESLLTDIANRGHEIGIHFSYNAYKNKTTMTGELDHLKKTLEHLGIKSPIFGGRQHFLRFEMPKTLQIWNELGLAYDSTMCFAEHSGFRAGTCSEFPVFDVLERKQLRLIERPLIIMECTFLDEKYMNIGYGQAVLDEMLAIKKIVKKYNGNFTFLWHNSYFRNNGDFELYEALMQ